MNWKAIIALSAYGVVIGIGVAFGFFKENTYLRLLILLFYPLWIGIKIGNKPFLHGFIIGILGDYIARIIILLFSHETLLKEEYSVNFVMGATLIYGTIMGAFIGFFSWVIIDLKTYARSLKLLIKEKKISLSVIRVLSIIASLLSFLGCIYFFGSSLAYCCGHGPRYEKYRFLENPIFPLASTWIFYRLGKFFLKRST